MATAKPPLNRLHALWIVVLLVVCVAAPARAFAQAASQAHAVTSGWVDVSKSTDGALLYQQLCQGCHQPGGVGAYLAVQQQGYPRLRANPRLQSAAYPIHVVLHGQAGMPSFKGMLSDAQVAAVVNHVLSTFNAATATANEADVASARKSAAPPAR